MCVVIGQQSIKPVVLLYTAPLRTRAGRRPACSWPLCGLKSSQTTCLHREQSVHDPSPNLLTHRLILRHIWQVIWRNLGDQVSKHISGQRRDRFNRPSISCLAQVDFRILRYSGSSRIATGKRIAKLLPHLPTVSSISSLYIISRISIIFDCISIPSYMEDNLSR